MKAIRYNDTVELRDGEDKDFFNLNYHKDCEELQKRVGKQVYDILSYTKRQWVDCGTLEIEE